MCPDLYTSKGESLLFQRRCTWWWGRLSYRAQALSLFRNLCGWKTRMEGRFIRNVGQSECTTQSEADGASIQVSTNGEIECLSTLLLLVSFLFDLATGFQVKETYLD